MAAPAHAALSEGARLAAIYDTILQARFDRAGQQLAQGCPPAPSEACKSLSVVALWWQIVLDPNADEYLRASMCEALAMVTLRGELDRDLAGRFLRDAFMEMQPQAECYAWVGWQSAIAMLGLSDLKTLVKKAFDRGY